MTPVAAIERGMAAGGNSFPVIPSGCVRGRFRSGRVKLYLLDSNDAANFPPDRGITSELYGGGPE